MDKVDSTYGIMAGAGTKAVLQDQSDEGIDKILARTELKRYIPYSIINKAVYKEEILELRKQGIAYDREEYIEGAVAFAVAIKANTGDLLKPPPGLLA